MYCCVGPFPHFSCWDVGWAHGFRGLGFLGDLQVPPEGNPRGNQLGWAAQRPCSTLGLSPMDIAERREEQGWTLGTKPASDTSTPGFNWVPLPHSLFAPQEIGAGHSCSSSCRGGPGQRHWNSQSITTSLCSSLRSAQGAAPMGCPGPSTARGDPCSQQVFLPTLPPFPEQAEQSWFGHHSDSHFQGCPPAGLTGRTSLTQMPTTALIFIIFFPQTVIL